MSFFYNERAGHAALPVLPPAGEGAGACKNDRNEARKTKTYVIGLVIALLSAIGGFGISISWFLLLGWLFNPENVGIMLANSVGFGLILLGIMVFFYYHPGTEKEGKQLKGQALIDELVKDGELEEKQGEPGVYAQSTARHEFYRLVSEGKLENTEEAWQSFKESAIEKKE